MYARLQLALLVLLAARVAAQEPAPGSRIDAPDPLERYAALRTLAARGAGARDELPAILGRLKDPEPWVRLEAGRTVVAVGAGRPHVDYLVGRLLVADVPLEQVLGVALADVGEGAVKPLVRLLDDEDAARRRKALVALSYFGRHATRAIPKLIGLLDDRDAAVKRLAGDALRRLGPWALDYVPELVDAVRLGDDRAKFVAARLLAQLGPAAKEAVPVLEEAARSGNGNVAGAAARALRRIDIRPKKERHPALLDPGRVKGRAPETYRVKLETTKGDIVVRVHRDWAPHGADRFYHLVRIGYYDDAAFFRVVPGFVAQFGLAADSRVTGAWHGRTIPDDPVHKSNRKGRVTFAQTSRKDSRSTQVFFNLGNNGALDAQGFAPFGEIVKGLDVAQALHDGYGDPPRGPDQRAIASMGNEYLKRRFPKLDYIRNAGILPDDPNGKGETSKEDESK